MEGVWENGCHREGGL
jgi:hypothetical protein